MSDAEKKKAGKVWITSKKLSRTPPSNGKPRCSCGYKIRGANHEAGSHHASGRSPASKQRTRWEFDGKTLTKAISHSRRNRGH